METAGRTTENQRCLCSRYPHASDGDPGVYGVSAEIRAQRKGYGGAFTGKAGYHARAAGTAAAVFHHHDHYSEYGKMGAPGAMVHSF